MIYEPFPCEHCTALEPDGWLPCHRHGKLKERVLRALLERENTTPERAATGQLVRAKAGVEQFLAMADAVGLVERDTPCPPAPLFALSDPRDIELLRPIVLDAYNNAHAWAILPVESRGNGPDFARRYQEMYFQIENALDKVALSDRPRLDKRP